MQAFRTLLLCSIIAQAALADDTLGPSPDKRLERCSKALYACSELVQAQDQAIVNLKAHVTELQSRLADAPPAFLPPWAAILTGVAAGLLLGVVISK